MGMKIGFLEPHLRCCGGIRRVLEFGNRLWDRGHQVTYYLPEDVDLSCTWMPCEGRIRSYASSFDDPLDVLVFNHEPQWHLLEHFTQVRRRVLYALHYARLYEKAGSWECLRAPVDAQLANSTWTAEQIEAETGDRPTVVLGGANRDVFHPRDVASRYPLLTAGADAWHDWKGYETVLAAGELLGLPVEAYAPKRLSQEELGEEYAAAEVFAVGSWFEGFGQPGLESLATGTPLVTTDNGGCREYAIDGETALVVEPRDPRAMADAIARLRSDPALARRLSANGLDLVAERFDWEQRTDELAEVLDGVVAGSAPAPAARPAPPPDHPELSVVVPAWGNLMLTQEFVESVRQNTTVPYELIIVDNGSGWEAASYARAAADRSWCNEANLGFAVGMNQGLALARGEYVAFCNNDTKLPPQWAERLIETARRTPTAGIVVPAVTTAQNPVNVRDEPGAEIELLPPFSAPPGAVLYLMATDVIRQLGGWSEAYEIASGEDVDLAFTVWVNDLDIVYDQRVLVDHHGKATSKHLEDWQVLWEQNRDRFLERWSGDATVPRLASTDLQRFRRNRETARAAAAWMRRYFTARKHGGGFRVRPSQAFRRAVSVGFWLPDLASVNGHPPSLVQGPDGSVWLMEGQTKRAVPTPALARALAAQLGPPRRVDAQAVEGWADGPPVVLLEDFHGNVSVVVGGRRHPVRSAMLTHSVVDGALDRFEPGDPLDLSG